MRSLKLAKLQLNDVFNSLGDRQLARLSSNNANLFVAAYDMESPESLLIELPNKRAQEILLQFGEDYEKMASSL